MELIIITSSFCLAALSGALLSKRFWIEFMSVLGSIVAFTYSIRLALKISESGAFSQAPLFYVDSFGALVVLIVTSIGLAVTLYSVAYLREETEKNVVGFSRVRQYFILLNLFLATMFLAITASSPIFTWIAVEATTLSTAFLISFYGKPSAIEAAWKYLVINSVGLLLAFLGTLLYFTSTKLTGGGILIDWQALFASTSNFDPMIAKIAFIFVLIGYGTKVGLAPMHTWLPDAHSNAPAPISALLSGVLLNVALLSVLRFKSITDLTVGPAFSQNLLITFGVLSIVIAAFIIFTQKNYKRLLAYSSIENMGIMSLGFGFGGIGIFAAILHMVYHALIKAALFLSAGTIFLRYDSTRISDVRGAVKALPVTSVIFLAGFFAITGTPPFGIFLTKIYILTAGITAYPAVTAVVLFCLAIMFVGFFKHATAMFFGEKPEDIATGEEKFWLIIPPLVLILLALYLSIQMPEFLYRLTTDVASHY